jgi:hypothetical protein
MDIGVSEMIGTGVGAGAFTVRLTGMLTGVFDAPEALMVMTAE